MYELIYKRERIALTPAYLSALGAAYQIKVLSALGCRKCIAFGCCSVLRKDITLGHLIITTAAVKDEETSYHYVKPSREIVANERVTRVIENVLRLALDACLCK